MRVKGWGVDWMGPRHRLGPNYLTAVFNGGHAGDDSATDAVPSRAEPDLPERDLEQSFIAPYWQYIRCALFLDVKTTCPSERVFVFGLFLFPCHVFTEQEVRDGSRGLSIAFCLLTGWKCALRRRAGLMQRGNICPLLRSHLPIYN